MKSLNVMELAWKIYKLTPYTSKFNFALKYAWKICKAGSSSLTNNTLILKTKTKIKIKYGVQRIKNSILIKFDSYDMNLFLYQLIHN